MHSTLIKYMYEEGVIRDCILLNLFVKEHPHTTLVAKARAEAFGPFDRRWYSTASINNKIKQDRRVIKTLRKLVAEGEIVEVCRGNGVFYSLPKGTR